jgi:methyl-accepting chemotaxis protein
MGRGVCRVVGPEMSALNEIAGKVGNLEGSSKSTADALKELSSGVTRLVDKLDQSDDIAKKALQSSEFAHKRLNSHDRIIFWAVTTFIGTVFIGAVTIFYKTQGG